MKKNHKSGSPVAQLLRKREYKERSGPVGNPKKIAILKLSGASRTVDMLEQTDEITGGKTND